MCGSFEIEKKSRDSAKLWKEWITNRILLFLHPRYYLKIHSKPNWYSHSDVSMRINWDELYGRYVCVRWWTGTFFFFFFKRRMNFAHSLSQMANGCDFSPSDYSLVFMGFLINGADAENFIHRMSHALTSAHYYFFIISRVTKMPLRKLTLMTTIQKFVWICDGEITHSGNAKRVLDTRANECEPNGIVVFSRCLAAITTTSTRKVWMRISLEIPNDLFGKHFVRLCVCVCVRSTIHTSEGPPWKHTLGSQLLHKYMVFLCLSLCIGVCIRRGV